MEITITTDLARVVGAIANRHKDDETASVNISWRESEAEQVWFVTVLRLDAEGNTDDLIYVVDDETGVHAPLTENELDRFHRGQSIFEEVTP